MEKLNILHKFLMITVAALFVVNQTVLFRIQQDLHDALPELRIKNEVIKQGTSEAHVAVTLRDERTIKGYISEISDDRFTITDPSSGNGSEVPFRMVKDISETSETGEGLIGKGLMTTSRAIESVAKSLSQ